MKNKVASNGAPKGASKTDVEQEVGECVQRVMHRLTTIGPSDQDVEHQIRECMQRIEEMKMLQKVDSQAFDDAIDELQEISIGNKQDPTLSQGMAESILLEFDRTNPISSSRADVVMALTGGADDEFMGGSDMFTSITEAKAKGEIK